MHCGAGVTNPNDILRRFVAHLGKDEREWLTVACAYQTEGESVFIARGLAQPDWFDLFLDAATEPEQKFGRVLWLIAILDFELSDLAIGRLAARWGRLATPDQKAPQEAIRRMKRLSDSWKDVRTNELDEAALWVYRDEAQRQQAAGKGNSA